MMITFQFDKFLWIVDQRFVQEQIPSLLFFIVRNPSHQDCQTQYKNRVPPENQCQKYVNLQIILGEALKHSAEVPVIFKQSFAYIKLPSSVDYKLHRWDFEISLIVKRFALKLSIERDNKRKSSKEEQLEFDVNITLRDCAVDTVGTEVAEKHDGCYRYFVK